MKFLKIIIYEPWKQEENYLKLNMIYDSYLLSNR